MVETVALLASGAAAGASATEAFRSRRLISRLRAVALCSHELRGALTAIGAAMSRLERPSETSDRSRFEALRHGYDRALLVARDLEAARGALPVRSVQRPELVDLQRGRGTSRRRVERVDAWRRRQVALDWRAGATHVHGYAMRLTQALDNLVANAVEHGRGPVTVTGRMSGSHVSVCVLDRGAGLVRPALRRSPALLAGAPRSRSGRRTPRRRIARRHTASGPGSVWLGDRGPAAGGCRSGSGARVRHAGCSPQVWLRRRRLVTPRRRAAAMLGASAVCAGLAVSAVDRYAGEIESQVGPLVPVVVAARDIPRGSIITPARRIRVVGRTAGATAVRATRCAQRAAAEAVGFEAASGIAAGDYVGASQLRTCRGERRERGLAGRATRDWSRWRWPAPRRCRRCCVRGRGSTC